MSANLRLSVCAAFAAACMVSGSGVSWDHYKSSRMSPIKSGDAIHLQLMSGKHMEVQDETRQVVAGSFRHGGQAPLFIRSNTDGPIGNGDAFHLSTHHGEPLLVDEEGHLKVVKPDEGSPTMFSITGGDGGYLYPEDTFYMKTMSGMLVVENKLGLVVASDAAQTLQRHKIVIRRKDYGAFHDVVGPDGVLMITLKRKGEAPRNTYSVEQLSRGRVHPIEFGATDAKVAPYHKLELTCPLEQEGTEEWCDNMGRAGQAGCRATIEQAITDSHRRALVAAQNRNTSYEWTAIIEDDVVPLEDTKFDQAFKEAWEKMPEFAKIVRLGWCTFESDLGAIRDRAFNGTEDGLFKLVRDRWWTGKDGAEHYYTGGCTTGYMVHKSFVPEFLKVFPCCCPIDCCMERQLFYASAIDGDEDDEWNKWRGTQIMVDLDGWTSRAYSTNYTTFNQSGILLQDNRNIKSERPEWNSKA